MMDTLTMAVYLSRHAHEGQLRKYPCRRDGVKSAYIDHPAMVAAYAATYYEGEPDRLSDLMAAAWLHDVVEDTDVLQEFIDKIFNGTTVPGLVQSLTRGRGMSQGQYLHQLDGASTEAQFLKGCDVLANLRDLHGAPPAFRDHYIRKVIGYLPIVDGALTQALREGIGREFR
jgi:(p)ppGpp synthase/HD superfamily hydrolase